MMNSMTIDEIKGMCIKMQSDITRQVKDRCAKCKYWNAYKGCVFYNMPCDWDIKEN